MTWTIVCSSVSHLFMAMAVWVKHGWLGPTVRCLLSWEDAGGWLLPTLGWICTHVNYMEEIVRGCVLIVVVLLLLLCLWFFVGFCCFVLVCFFSIQQSFRRVSVR